MIDSLAVDIFQWTRSNYPRLHLPSPAIMTTTVEFRLSSSNESWTDFPQTTVILNQHRMIDSLAVDIFQRTRCSYPRLHLQHSFEVHLPSPTPTAVMTTSLEFRLSSSNESWTDLPQTTFNLNQPRVIDNLESTTSDGLDVVTQDFISSTSSKPSAITNSSHDNHTGV
ncbi:unnamed protein product [Cyberlindnera jadinii]|uniref:Uncharacterized protein n=1 Tax=Cyberlindnera jadinii (strain ATCC 18201 / CBS 1600 / BCRC 20928 / JCM 3617 / NBRC 0987 / NRRL Y-1542) TaxID=983966 RepID=A0A0H5C8D0_CYBJN|nr:unnamed protein product [Cyberlindnera jadinii]